jgi:hypothetical protein
MELGSRFPAAAPTPQESNMSHAMPPGPGHQRDAGLDLAGAHPLGTGLGALGGGIAGATTGAIFGPIGMLVGVALGTIAGGVGGHRAAEHIDPTGESEYWREAHRDRPYVESRYHYETDYQPAYRFGVERRNETPQPQWDDSLEPVLHEEWLHRRANSALTWQQARPAVRDAWERVDRSYRVYEASDRYHAQRFEEAGGGMPNTHFGDYRPAYRYGTWARSHWPQRDWDEALEQELERGWVRVKGTSRLSWEKARAAVREAWHAAADVLRELGDGH